MSSRPAPWFLRSVPILATVGFVALLGAVYLLAGGVRTEVNAVFALMAAGNIDGLRDYILSYGIWAPIVSVSLMVLQSLIAPLPASLVVFANGLAFGTLPGIAISLLGQILASLVCFGLARLVGRTVVEHLVSKPALAAADGWFNRWGMLGIIGLRLVPGPGFDVVSYAAGLTSFRVGPFLLATAVGSLPQVVLYAFLGSRAPQHLDKIIVATLVFLAGLGLFTLWRTRRQAAAGSADVAVEPVRQPVEAG